MFLWSDIFLKHAHLFCFLEKVLIVWASVSIKIRILGNVTEGVHVAPFVFRLLCLSWVYSWPVFLLPSIKSCSWERTFCLILTLSVTLNQCGLPLGVLYILHPPPKAEWKVIFFLMKYLALAKRLKCYFELQRDPSSFTPKPIARRHSSTMPTCRHSPFMAV